MAYKIKRPIPPYYIPLSDKIEKQLDAEWDRGQKGKEEVERRFDTDTKSAYWKVKDTVEHLFFNQKFWTLLEANQFAELKNKGYYYSHPRYVVVKFTPKGKGWRENPDHTGKAPEHRKAALKAERKGEINEPIRTGGKNMGERHHIRLDELIDSAKPTMHAMLDQALNSGALTEEMKEDNYLLAKAVITIWGRKENYAPLDHKNKAHVRNLEHFI